MKGFSLVEIMVVVAIIAIMASSVVIGFGSFERTVRVRETAGVITDTLKKLELDMIRRDYARQTIHFEKDYLVSEAEAENQASFFSLDRSGNPCPDGEELEATNTSGSPIYLAQRDAEGNNLEISIIPISATPKEVCVKFMDSEEAEWNYQLFKGSEVSQTIRFIHFNIRRDDDSSTRAVITDNNYTLQITAPYAAKEFYDNGILTDGPVLLTVKNNDDQHETVTLQE